MLFGHGSWNTFHADTKQVFRAEAKKYATITKDAGLTNPYIVTYSTGSRQQFRQLSSAKNFANQYEQSGNVIDLSDGQPRDAEVSEWSGWSKSGSCDLKRTRTIIFPAFLGGSTPELQEIKPNHYKEDATVSAWSDWGECNDGTQIRTRTITSVAKCGGKTPPPSALQQSRDCTVATTDTDETTTTDDGTTITSDDEQDSIETGDTTGSGTDDSTVTTQTSDVTIVSAGASSGMSTGKKVMVGVLVVGVIGGAVYYRAKKM